MPKSAERSCIRWRTIKLGAKHYAHICVHKGYGPHGGRTTLLGGLHSYKAKGRRR